MNIEELNTLLADAVLSIGEVKVDEDFIDFRNKSKDKFKANRRDEETRLKNADCLLLEYTLIKNNLVKASTDKVHDICVHNFKIDLKCIESSWYTPKTDNIPWMLEGIKNGLLTHFAFYHMSRPARPLKVGDKIRFEYIKVEDAMTVLNNLKLSKFNDGYYFGVK